MRRQNCWLFRQKRGQWDVYRRNEALPGLHESSSWLSTSGIGAHFLAGTILVLLGPVQFIDRLRLGIGFGFCSARMLLVAGLFYLRKISPLSPLCTDNRLLALPNNVWHLVSVVTIFR